jgi:hypothetical protein
MLAKVRVGRVGTLSSLTKEQLEQQDTTVSKNSIERLEHANEVLKRRAKLEDLVE